MYKIKPVSKRSFQTKLEEQQKDKLVERLKMFTKVILVATFVNFPLDIYHQILNDSSLNNCHNKLLENDTFQVYALIPVNEYYKVYRSK